MFVLYKIETALRFDQDLRKQGVPINMGIERRLENHLWFPIIDKWHKVHQKKIETSNVFSKMLCTSLYLEIDGDIKHFNSCVDEQIS